MKEEIVNERQCETEDEKIDIQQFLNILFIGRGLSVPF